MARDQLLIRVLRGFSTKGSAHRFLGCSILRCLGDKGYEFTSYFSALFCQASMCFASGLDVVCTGSGESRF